MEDPILASRVFSLHYFTFLHKMVIYAFERYLLFFFCKSYLLKLSLGFGIVIVNYRGSLGWGENHVRVLLGNISNFDVSDCYLGAQQALQQFPWLNPKKMVLFGGSHGGFIVTHLSSQYPVRNLSLSRLIAHLNYLH